jgi:hypothetical protein
MTRQWSPYKTQTIFKRDGGICIYCGNNYATAIDHVIPYLYGGVTDVSNGVCCCTRCNNDKMHHLEKYLEKGILWLMTHGEDTSWMNNIDMKRIEHSKTLLSNNGHMIQGNNCNKIIINKSNPRKYIQIEDDDFKEYGSKTVEIIYESTQVIYKEKAKHIDNKSLSDQLDEIRAILNRNNIK